jgi:trans-aconitate methyltransferase
MSNVVGQFDILEYDNSRSRLRVSGWAVTSHGSAQQYFVIAPDGSRVAMKPVLRPDLADALPHIAGIERSGFDIVGEGIALEPGQAIDSAVILVTEGVDIGVMPFGYRRPTRQIPVPAPELMLRVSGSSSRSHFLNSGNRNAQDIARLLKPHCDPLSVRAFLDWGCGCGRVTRHLLDVFPNAAAHGTDIDHEAIEWLANAIPDGEFHSTGLMPPLPSETGRYDFVLASSVFTHLTADAQRAWLDELARVIRPGGILMATTHGDFAAGWLRNPAIQRALADDGFFDSARDEALGHIASGEYYRSTFQTPEYTRRRWLDDFAELAYHVAGLNFHQDVWVLERK